MTSGTYDELTCGGEAVADGEGEASGDNNVELTEEEQSAVNAGVEMARSLAHAHEPDHAFRKAICQNVNSAEQHYCIEGQTRSYASHCRCTSQHTAALREFVSRGKAGALDFVGMKYKVRHDLHKLAGRIMRATGCKLVTQSDAWLDPDDKEERTLRLVVVNSTPQQHESSTPSTPSTETKRAPLKVVVQCVCEGVSQTGKRCELHSNFKYEEAEPLRQGKRLCFYNRHQHGEPCVDKSSHVCKRIRQEAESTHYVQGATAMTNKYYSGSSKQ